MQAAPRASDLVGKTLMGKLRVERVLGAGGMGTVYAVQHLITRHERALKVLHAQHGQSHETVARFIREAGVAGTLRTPYVVETYDAGTLEDGAAYVLMELLHGQALASLLDRGEPVSSGRMVGIVCQVLEGLSVAHDAGIVHRDIKPDNLFLVSDEQGRERVKILDFGISKFTHGVADYAGTLTSEGTMMGTPYYMSPEQASGAKEVDARTDLYSLGVILYEGLAGVRPFDGQTLAALVIRIHKGECVPIDAVASHVSPGLARVVRKAMSPDRNDRFESAREMLAALIPFADSSYVASLHTLREVIADAATLQHPSMPAPPRTPREPVDEAITIEAIARADSARPSRDRTLAIAAAIILALGAGGALAWAMQGGPGDAIAADGDAPTASPPLDPAGFDVPIVDPDPIPAGASDPVAPDPVAADTTASDPVPATDPAPGPRLGPGPGPRLGAGPRPEPGADSPRRGRGGGPGPTRPIDRDNPY